MKIFNSKSEISQTIVNLKKQDAKIGFVPTMGALHQGHLSLVQKGLEETDFVIVSIFVNPTQFDKQEDLIKYPRDLDRDIDLLKTVSEDNILVFSPSVEDIYGNDVESTQFSFDGLEYEMEGKFRVGHFDGVGTIIKRFFEILQPDNAYFGEKDFQQLMIVKKLAEKYKLNVKVVGCEIYRESNGLAMSSRNERLTDQQKEEASLIHKTLKTAKKMFGMKNVNEIIEWVSNEFKNNELLKLEYFIIADANTLKPIQEKSNKNTYRAFIAAYANNVRLIDNMALN